MLKEDTLIVELSPEQLEMVSGGKGGGGGRSNSGRDRGGPGGASKSGRDRDGGFRGKGASGKWDNTQGCTDTGWGVDAGVSVNGNIGVVKGEAHVNGHYESKTNGCGRK